MAWGFGDEPQLTYGWALAVCYHVGFRGKDLIKAVALMTAESQRYPAAWHENIEDGLVKSTDWGLFQINDKWHPTFELPEGLNVIYNARYAKEMYRTSQGFSPWAAYDSGAYLKYMPAATAAWTLGRWKNKVPNVEKHFA